MTDRRAFLTIIAGGFLAAPLGADAQQAGKVYRVGCLWPGQRDQIPEVEKLGKIGERNSRPSVPL